MSIAVSVVGATGRLGQVVCDVVSGMADFGIHATLTSSSNLDELAGSDIVVDATQHSVSETVVEHALGLGAKVLVGTSGWNAEKLRGLSAALEAIPGAAVLVVPNFSIGSVLATALAAMAARHFDSIEIVEAHHLAKVDSPSGTAVRTAETIAAARQGLGELRAPHTNQSARGELVAGLPVHSLRLSGLIAWQDVIFGGLDETLTIRHETLSPASYRPGIELALRSLVTQSGLVVGLEGPLGISGW